ncbi:MAG: ABC transporter permease [Dongiaceae bacterium]
MAEPSGAGWGLSLRLARRELRGGIRGFRIFLACLMLGVATIAGVGSIAAAVRAGIAADARAVLGGDLELRLLYGPATPAQRDFLAARGALSETRELRAMARPAAPGAQAAGAKARPVLVELKAVDGAYPLYGAATLRPDGALGAALARRDGAWGAVADPALLQRLGLAVGDRIRVGSLDYRVAAALTREPDRGTGIFNLGPRLMVAADSLAETGLIQPGSLVTYQYRLRLPPGEAAGPVVDALKQAFPGTPWRIRTLEDAAPGTKRFIDRTAMFLTLVGLSTLLVGGVGVANAVRAYLAGRGATIATLKCLGAPAALVRRTYLLLIMGLAAGGVVAGLLVGALAPLGLAGLLDAALPVRLRLALYPMPLALAAGFGLLTALAFSLPALRRAGTVAPVRLFRGAVDLTTGPAAERADWRGLLWALPPVAGLAALTVAGTGDWRMSAGFAGVALAALALFRGAAWGVAAAARRLNRPGRVRSAMLRLALANLYRPGAATGSAVLSLGIGLTVLVAIAVIEGDLSREISETLPKAAPSFYFLDIQPGQAAAFDAAVAGVPGAGALARVPMLRGRITAVAGVPADKLAPKPQAAWALQGDRGITWSATLPPGSRVVAGAWWPADYRGPPLVSLDAEVAEGLGVKPGDTLTVNVLGREITATVANLRRFDWLTLSINFVMVFSPGMLEGAPRTDIATVHADPAAETAIETAVTDRFPNISAIRVRDALAAIDAILGQVAGAVRATAAITLLAGVLVLGGAVIAGHHRRVHDAVVLKVLGATRPALALGFALEYGFLGLVTAALAALLGSVGAWLFVTRALEAPWAPLPGTVAATALVGLLVTLLLGFAGTWRALGEKAAPHLRNE